MNIGALPVGWTLQRVREVAGLTGVPRLVDLASTVVLFETPEGPQPMDAQVAIDCDGQYCVVLDEEGEWSLGSWKDQTIICWGLVGPDLAEALRSL